MFTCLRALGQKRPSRNIKKSSHTTSHPPPHYEPLDPALKEIRVLEVAPTSGDGLIECTMKRISLLNDPVPVYETISYCWGPPRAPSTIRVDGCLASVPASSEAAVRRMRHNDRPRILWIDAICIDQSSVTERSAQVAFMSTVYRVAKHNLIYLGEDEGMAERGVKAVQYVVDDMRAATADLTLSCQTMFDEATGAELYSNEGFGADIDFEALKALFSCHWFRRLWVLQEVILAESNTCHYGTQKFDLLDTIRAAQWLNFKCRSVPGGLHDSFGWRCALKMYGVFDPDNVLGWRKMSLVTVWRVTQDFETTEPRDSIFAVLGLLDEKTLLEGDHASLLRVDYTKSLADVLRDATRWTLSQTCHLMVLGSVNHDSDALADSQTFSTWTYRADVLPPDINISYLPLFFQAFKGLEAPSSLSDVSFGEDVLLLEGIVVDEVLRTTTPCVGRDYEEDEGFHEWLISVTTMAMHHCNMATQEDFHLAIAFTLVAARARHGNKAQPKDLQVLVEYIKGLTMRKSGAMPNGTSYKSGVDKERMLEMLEASPVVYCERRRFFVTTAGRIGLGPRCMQPEDVVVVLRGAFTPFILRKKSDDHQLLGPAYVHGIMHGEAVQIAREKGTLEEVFHVR